MKITVIARRASPDAAIQPIGPLRGGAGLPRSLRSLAMTLLLLLPAAAQATKLAVCDGKTHEVTINNDGQVHQVTLSPASGSIEEFGPRVSMQLEGQKPVTITEQYDEYCIWDGRIKLQQVRSGNDSLSGNGGGR